MRTYTDTEKAEAVGLAMTLGDKAAAERIGVPRRTVTYWRAHAQGVVKIAPATAGDVAAELWQAVTEGLAAVRAGLNDPKARLGDRARALGVLIESHRLMTNQSTANNVNLNVNGWVDPMDALSESDRRALIAWLDHVDAASDQEVMDNMPMIHEAFAGGSPEALARLDQSADNAVPDERAAGDE